MFGEQTFAQLRTGFTAEPDWLTNAPLTLRSKLQALVYDLLPSTTAVFSYVKSPFLTGRMFVRRTYFGQFDEL